MSEDGQGQWSAEIAGRSQGDIVQFYVEGTDGLGAVSLYPPAGPDSRALPESRMRPHIEELLLALIRTASCRAGLIKLERVG